MPHRIGPSPGNHTTWVELLLAPLPVKWTGNVSCHVQIHSRRGFGVGASIDRQRKINTDAAAAAYAWEHSLPMDRTSAVKALAQDFCDYMEDLIHKKQVAGNASNSAQGALAGDVVDVSRPERRKPGGEGGDGQDLCEDLQGVKKGPPVREHERSPILCGGDMPCLDLTAAVDEERVRKDGGLGRPGLAVRKESWLCVIQERRR